MKPKAMRCLGVKLYKFPSISALAVFSTTSYRLPQIFSSVELTCFSKLDNKRDIISSSVITVPLNFHTYHIQLNNLQPWRPSHLQIPYP